MRGSALTLVLLQSGSEVSSLEEVGSDGFERGRDLKRDFRLVRLDVLLVIGPGR